MPLLQIEWATPGGMKIRRACARSAARPRSPSSPRLRARGRSAPAPCARESRRRPSADRSRCGSRPAASPWFPAAPAAWTARRRSGPGYCFHGVSTTLRITAGTRRSSSPSSSSPRASCRRSAPCAESAAAPRRRCPAAGCSRRRARRSGRACSSFTACSSAPLNSCDFVTVRPSTPAALPRPRNPGCRACGRAPGRRRCRCSRPSKYAYWRSRIAAQAKLFHTTQTAGMSYSTAVQSTCGTMVKPPSPQIDTQGLSGAASLAPRIALGPNPMPE